MKPFAPDLAARIQRQINDLQPSDPLRDWPTRVCKEELNALLLLCGLLYVQDEKESIIGSS